MEPVLCEARFHNEEAAYAWVEAALWPDGPVCYHCKGSERIGKIAGKTTRIGLYKCYSCKKPFTVKMGTVFESSHVPMHIWLQGIYLLSSSKKGISTRQLQRVFGCGLKTAWFMSHRIREAMKEAGIAPLLGGAGRVVEADETEIAPSRKTAAPDRVKRGNNRRIASLVERGGTVRSRMIDQRGMSQVRQAVRENLAPGTILHTDGAQAYKFLMPLGQHEAVNHNKAFARDSNNGGRVHTNTVEGYFSLFKRGLVGTYHHMGEQHLHRYLAEFDFRHNYRVKLGFDDMQRSQQALLGVVGKRLTYKATATAS